MCGIGHREREREREIYVLRLRFSCQIRLRERNCSIFEYFLDYICIYINRVCGIGQRERERERFARTHTHIHTYIHAYKQILTTFHHTFNQGGHELIYIAENAEKSWKR